MSTLYPALEGAIEMVDILDIICVHNRLGLAGAGTIDAVDQHTVPMPEFIDASLEFRQRDINGTGNVRDAEFHRFAQIHDQG